MRKREVCVRVVCVNKAPRRTVRAGPKAPRSHYDHVTHKLVLNMDHYCPWMFNVVGFANYRYFVLFLFYVATACVYGLSLTAEPILVAGKWIARREGRQRLSQSARSAVLFTFALSLSVGIAVSILFGTTTQSRPSPFLSIEERRLSRS